MTQSPGNWPERSTMVQQQVAASHSANQLSGCSVSTRENPSVNIPLKIIKNNEIRMASGNTGWPGAPSRAHLGPTDINLPKTWVGTAVTIREECGVAGCQPAQLCYGTKGLFCPIVEMHYLLLKYT